MSAASVTLAMLLSISGAYRVDSTVVVPMPEFRRAVALLVDDSLCRIQTTLQDSALRMYDSAYRVLERAYDARTREAATLRQAVEAADAARVDNLAAAEAQGKRAVRNALLLKVTVPVVAVVCLLLGHYVP